MGLQEEILAALPEEKRPLMDSVQDEINTLMMDEGESAFIEGVTFGVRLMMEVGENKKETGSYSPNRITFQLNLGSLTVIFPVSQAALFPSTGATSFGLFSVFTAFTSSW